MCQNTFAAGAPPRTLLGSLVLCRPNRVPTSRGWEGIGGKEERMEWYGRGGYVATHF